MMIKIPEGCKSYKTWKNAEKAVSKEKIPTDVSWFIVAQDDRFYPVIIMTPKTSQMYGVLWPFYTTGTC